VTPLIAIMVARLNKLFSDNKSLAEAKYINADIAQSPELSIEAIEKEIEHLFKNGFKIISASLGVKPKAIKKTKTLKPVMEDAKVVALDVDKSYQTVIKPLEIEIAKFSIDATVNMNSKEIQRVDELRIATRDVVEAIKDIKHLKKNFDKFQVSENQHIKKEYLIIKEMIANTLRVIDMIVKSPNDKDAIKAIAKIKNEQMRLNSIKNNKANRLIKENKIDTADVISLMNDSTYANDLIFKLCELVENLYINKSDKLKEAYKKYQKRFVPTQEEIEAVSNKEKDTNSEIKNIKDN
jgi:phosphate:Na+ symporter